MLPVVKIQRFSTHDGEGVRTVVFLKGCPLRCKWCHNPETQSLEKQFLFLPLRCIGCGACMAVCAPKAHVFDGSKHWIDRKKCIGCMSCVGVCPAGALEQVGRDMTEEEILKEVEKDRVFFGEKGGLTLSGGEPMIHGAEAVLLLERAKERGLNTAIETCGFFDSSYIEGLAQATDLFLWDFKDADPARHETYTGVSNERILKNLFLLDRYPVRIELRCIMVKGVNMDPAEINRIIETAAALKHLTKVTLLPYHPYGVSKGEQAGMEVKANPLWIPDAKEIEGIQAQINESLGLGGKN